MGSIRNKQIKQLTSSGAVTTNNVAGKLYRIIASADTAGNNVIVSDGATAKLRIFIQEDGVVDLDFGTDGWEFTTDIDATIAGSGNTAITFHYSEVV